MLYIRLSKFGYRYVLIVESETHCSLTQNNRSADITYSQRINSTRTSNTLILSTLPPHLYGQIVCTDIGLGYLQEGGFMNEMLQVNVNVFFISTLPTK